MKWFFVFALCTGVSLPAQAQTCSAKQKLACETSCGPATDVGARRFQQCLTSCLAKCTKPPPTCKNQSGTVTPRYYVAGLIYQGGSSLAPRSPSMTPWRRT
jgi:hypothetical protein